MVCVLQTHGRERWWNLELKLGWQFSLCRGLLFVFFLGKQSIWRQRENFLHREELVLEMKTESDSLFSGSGDVLSTKG